MKPFRPDAAKAENVARHRSLRLEGSELPCDVTQCTRLNDVDLLALCTGHKRVLPRRRHVLDHRGMANLPREELVILMTPVAPNGQGHELAEEHLFVKVHLEPIWNTLQKDDLPLCQSKLVGALLLEDVVDLAIQLCGHVALVEEPNQQGVAFELLRSGTAQGAHGRGDGTDKGRESSHRQQDHPNGKKPFCCIDRRNVVRCRRKLGEGPVDGDGVRI
mmetsp:Transcript_6756/g.15691  ORF Transcript_6756/g.15691 Transcript_6756/m.15691 type:complete len:218 (+) Transcript_6756:496-1149(+)